jgi:hypothetical protein
LTSNGSKKAWPPRKTPQNDGYIMSAIQQTVRRRRIVPTRRIRRDKKRREGLEEINKKTQKGGKKNKRITKRKDPKTI